MNEKIKTLAKVAGINVIPRRPYIDEEPDGYLESDNDFILNNHEVVIKLLEGDALKKFAELIVEECAKVLWDSNDILGEYRIKKHFGVEE